MLNRHPIQSCIIRLKIYKIIGNVSAYEKVQIFHNEHFRTYEHAESIELLCYVTKIIIKGCDLEINMRQLLTIRTSRADKVVFLRMQFVFPYIMHINHN